MEKNKIDMVIAHQQELDILCHSIKHEQQGSIPQCFYVVGNMGSGKTTLLRQLEQAFSDSDAVTPVFLDCLLNDIRNFDDLQQFLRDHAQQRVLLLADDFHIMFNKWKEGELSKLRALLFSNDAPIMVASGIGIPQQLTDYNAPMYDSLSIITLGSISIDIFLQIINERVKPSKSQTAMARNVYDTIGASPLVAVLTAESLLKKPKSVEELTKSILTKLSFYYKEVLSSLTLVQRSAVLSLAKAMQGLNFHELRESTRLSSGSLSSVIDSLISSGFVGVQREKAKKSRYFLNEKMLKKWIALSL